jgi:pilus assembly protein FimV
LEAGAPEQTAEINLEELGMDLELGATGEYALQDLAERAPEFTEESVEIDLEDETFADDGTLRIPGGQSEPADSFDEAASEDDGGTQMLEAAQMRRRSESPTQRGEGWELAEDEPTVSGFGGYEEDTEVDQTLIKKVEPFHEAPTTEVAGFEDDDDANLGLDELTQALKADVDIAADAEPTRQTPGFEPEPEEAAEQQLGDTAEMPPAETNEVGTKLDLARAYIDMGDPEGARSILGEVVAEGDEGQQGEARQLLESLA